MVTNCWSNFILIALIFVTEIKVHIFGSPFSNIIADERLYIKISFVCFEVRERKLNRSDATFRRLSTNIWPSTENLFTQRSNLKCYSNITSFIKYLIDENIKFNFQNSWIYYENLCLAKNLNYSMNKNKHIFWVISRIDNFFHFQKNI